MTELQERTRESNQPSEEAPEGDTSEGKMGFSTSESFSYASQKKWLSKAVIGALLACIPIVNFFVSGYLLRVMQQGIRRTRGALPEWTDWGDMFVDGLLMGCATLIYTFVPGIIALFTIVPAIFASLRLVILSNTSITDSPNRLFDGLSSIMIGEIITVVVILALLYFLACFLLPMAIANYAKTGKFRSFFDLRKILSCVRKRLGQYIVTLLLGIALMITINIIIWAVNLFLIITIIGILVLIPLFIFEMAIGLWISIALHHAFGAIYGEAESS